MNKKQLSAALILACLLLTALCSCRSDGPEDISGLWSGYVYTTGGGTYGTVVFDFKTGGDTTMGDVEDDIIWDEAIQQNYTWSLNDDYLTLSGWFGLYFSEYAYELNGDSLTLVLIRRNSFNGSFDRIACGDRIELNRDVVSQFSDYFDSSQ